MCAFRSILRLIRVFLIGTFLITPFSIRAEPADFQNLTISIPLSSENQISENNKLELETRITDLKTQGLYNHALWDEYFNTSNLYRKRISSSLDQGGDVCSTATVINALAYIDSGTTIGYQNNYYCPAPSPAPDVVYQYTPTTNQLVDISLCFLETNFDTKLIVFENVCLNTYIIACTDDDCPGLKSQIDSLQLYAGNTYYIVVDGWGSSAGNYRIEVDRVTQPPLNDNCEDAI